MNESYVLDSYAILCLFREQAGAEQVEKLLQEGRQQKVKLYMSLVNLAEVYYSIYRAEGEIQAQQALTFIYDFPLELVDVNLNLALTAAKLKARYPIALADCFAAALAHSVDGKLVTGDPEFKSLENEISVFWLLTQGEVKE